MREQILKLIIEKAQEYGNRAQGWALLFGRDPQSAKDKPATNVPQQHDVEERHAAELPVKAELRLDDLVLNEATLRTSPMLPYVGMFASLVEGMRLRRHELLQQLLQFLRQHSIAYRTRTDYVLRFLHQHPP